MSDLMKQQGQDFCVIRTKVEGVSSGIYLIIISDLLPLTIMSPSQEGQIKQTVVCTHLSKNDCLYWISIVNTHRSISLPINSDHCY